MTYELKPGQGSLFQNDRKQSDNHPDYTGSFNVDGVEYWLNGWKKQGKNGGKPFLSLSFKKKEARGRVEDAPRAPAPDLDDSIPFMPEVR